MGNVCGTCISRCAGSETYQAKMMKHIAWTQDAQAQLTRAIAPEYIHVIKDQVDTGVAKLWHCKDKNSECYIVTRLEPAPLELCFVCAAGTGALKFGKIIMDSARKENVPMRCHVSSTEK